MLAFYRNIKEKGVPIKYSLNHATEFSFYFEDPEGHLIEIYWATNLPIPDNYAEPIDLDLSEEELLREVDRLAAHLEFNLHRCRAERAIARFSKPASESRMVRGTLRAD